MITDMPTFLQTSALILLGFAASFVALIIAARFSARRGHMERPRVEPPVFLFDGDTLVDASESGGQMAALSCEHQSDLAWITEVLNHRFVGLSGAVRHFDNGVPVSLMSEDGRSTLTLNTQRHLLRIAINDHVQGDARTAPDRHLLNAATDGMSDSRAINNAAPLAMWTETCDGRITWVNGAYRRLEMATGQNNPDATTPMRLFTIDTEIAGKPAVPQRLKLDFPGHNDPCWFEFRIVNLGVDRLITALPIDRVVQAEHSLRDFVQTLTQTFAHLNVGLAVFGRGRELAIFNPALSDLLEIAPEFLAKRPTLFAVFDRLREQRMMPEPKDYNSWVAKMSALEAAAADGVHSETWSLVDGRTYRITGRPHPDGAVAFLFEDISAGITLERRFRSDLQVGQSVIDSIEEALAVFSPAGTLTTWNTALLKLWKIKSPEAQVSFLDLSRVWQDMCAPTPVWGDARDFAATTGARSNWTAEVRTRTGRKLACRFQVLPGGSTLVGFSDLDAGHDALTVPMRHTVNA